MEEKIKARIRELEAQLSETIQKIKDFKETNPPPNLETLDKTDAFTKQLLTQKSAIAELKALLE